MFVKKLPPKAPDPISRDQSNPISRDQSNKVNNEEEPVTTASKIAKAEDKHMNKKRKLLEGYSLLSLQKFRFVGDCSVLIQGCLKYIKPRKLQNNQFHCL